MKVFLSWSGARSQMIANALRTWLNDCLHHLDPWMSSEDIAKGANWSHELFAELETTRIGVICLTPENFSAPWILFESGAIGKTLSTRRVCTYLFDLQPTDLTGPLTQFQATTAQEYDTRKLLNTLNDALEPHLCRSKEQVDKAFIKWWPELKKTLDQIPSRPQVSEPDRKRVE